MASLLLMQITGTAVGYGGTILHTTNGVPVELTSFASSSNGKEVILNWTTATELNNQGFEIQRSNDNMSFKKIGFVPGCATTTEPKSYSYLDQSVVNGTYYYRLKQIDYDGSYEYSDVVEVELREFNSYVLKQNYPNPFNPSTTFRCSIPNESKVIIKVYDILGKEIETPINEDKPAGTYEIMWNAANSPSGIYLYRMLAGSFIQTRKMILLK